MIFRHQLHLQNEQSKELATKKMMDMLLLKENHLIQKASSRKDRSMTSHGYAGS